MLPPGDSSSYSSNGLRVLIDIGVCTLTALIVVICRNICRAYLSHNFGWDDALINVSMTLSLVASTLAVFSVSVGAGKHIQQLSPADVKKGLHINFVSQPFGLIAISTVKISSALLLLRVTKGTNHYKRWERFLISMIIFLLVATIAAIVSIFAQCRPIAAIWDIRINRRKACWNLTVTRGLSNTNTVINIITDFTFSLLPILWLRKSQMQTRVKFTLCAILCLGILASVVAIIKIPFTIRYIGDTDQPWGSAYLTMLNATELNVGIIAASVPTLRPLYVWLYQKSTGRLPPVYNTSGSYSLRHPATNVPNHEDELALFQVTRIAIPSRNFDTGSVVTDVTKSFHVRNEVAIWREDDSRDIVGSFGQFENGSVKDVEAQL